MDFKNFFDNVNSTYKIAKIAITAKENTLINAIISNEKDTLVLKILIATQLMIIPIKIINPYGSNFKLVPKYAVYIPKIPVKYIEKIEILAVWIPVEYFGKKNSIALGNKINIIPIITGSNKLSKDVGIRKYFNIVSLGLSAPINSAILGHIIWATIIGIIETMVLDIIATL